jgi:hypothetical protein
MRPSDLTRVLLPPALFCAAGLAVAEDQPAPPPVAPDQAAPAPAVAAPNAPAPAPAPAAAVAPPPPPPSNWTHKGRLGLFFTDVYANGNAAQSPDPTVRGTTNSMSYLGSFEGTLEWRENANSLQQDLTLKYGRLKQEHIDWVTNSDEARYEGVYRREVAKPTFIYLGWGAKSVFLGPSPDKDAFDPITTHVSVGVGQRWDNLLPEKDKLEWRLGVRAQKTWGRYLNPPQDDLLVGPEAYLRYEREVSKELRYFIQYEGFAPFTDLGHVSNLCAAGLAAQLSTHLTVELNLRAYYESHPKNADPLVTGYDHWGVRQDSMLGLTYLF